MYGGNKIDLKLVGKISIPRFTVTVLILLLMVSVSHGKYYQPRKIVSRPTAGMLGHGAYCFGLELFPNDGVQCEAIIGIIGRLQIGFSYGGENILGEGDINWNPRLEFTGKLRVINESVSIPAFAVGFNSQGEGGYVEQEKRYIIKSVGLYLCASKNFKTIGGNVGFHGGINYSFETSDGNKNPSLYLGFDKEIGKQFSINMEYDIATNDNKKGDEMFGRGRGYLNFSFCWAVSQAFELEIILKDLLLNNELSTTFMRGLRLNIYNSF
ncbi:hypothetical protein JXI42_13450 [bacterium]|nr:hypothetical protein [bacterium]